MARRGAGYVWARSDLRPLFFRDRSGAAALEFAIVAMPLLICILFAMTIGLVLFMRQQLDFGTLKASRQIMNGTVQKAGYSSSDFRTQVVCPSLPAIFNCNDVIVNVQTVIEAASPKGYYGLLNSDQSGVAIPNLSNGVTQYSVGTQGSYEYVQVIYPITFLPTLIITMLSSQTYGGNPAYLAVSTAAFRNEQY